MSNRASVTDSLQNDGTVNASRVAFDGEALKQKCWLVVVEGCREVLCYRSRTDTIENYG